MVHGAGGEVRVRVTGASLERFLNLCMRAGVRPRGMDRQDWNRMECTLSLADFRRLRRVMGRTGCRVHILRRSGLPFLLRTMRRRAVLTGGFLLLAVLLWALQTHLWIIELKTPPGVSSAELSRALEEEGVTIGMRLSDFDDRAVQRRLMLKLDSISYVTFNRTGNHMIVEAHAKQEKPEIRDDGGITSVVARRAGQIVRVTATGGWPVVQPGDIVDVGEKLIDAKMPPSQEVGQPRLTWSGGEVIARTWHEMTILRPLTVTGKRYTGKKTTQFALIWGNRRINLYLGSGISGMGCDKIVEVKRLSVTDGLTLPVALVRQTYLEYEPAERALDPEALRAEVESRASAALADEVRGEVTGCSSAAREENGALVVDFFAEALEDIGEVVVDNQTLPETESTE